MTILIVICTFIFTIIISPFICFGVGYLEGLLLQFTIGEPFITGINLLFHTNFTKYNLPLLFGSLSILIGYAVSIVKNNFSIKMSK